MALQMTHSKHSGGYFVKYCSRNTVTNEEGRYLPGGIFPFRWSICFKEGHSQMIISKVLSLKFLIELMTISTDIKTNNIN